MESLAGANRILCFTMHRSGSTFLHLVCREATRMRGIPYTSPNQDADQVVTARQLAQRSFWANKKGCFGPLRIFMDVPDRSLDRIILHLRDPRDVLTSMFYSYCYAHPGEIPPNTGYRREIAQRGIDDFVIRMASSREPPVTGDYGTGGHLWDLAGNVLFRYRQYIDNLVGKQNVEVLRYEEMVSDRSSWLRKIAKVFDPVGGAKLAAQLSERIGPESRPAYESAWAHVRRVTPGDHKEKLSPETIDKINDLFADVLRALSY